MGAPFFLTAAALAASSYLTDPTLTMIVLTFAAIGIFCIFGVFWALPTAWLSGTAAAGAIALINSIGNLAGYGGPYLVGWVKDATGNTSTGLLVLAVLPLISGLLVFLAGQESKVEFASAERARRRAADPVTPGSRWFSSSLSVLEDHAARGSARPEWDAGADVHLKCLLLLTLGRRCEISVASL